MYVYVYVVVRFSHTDVFKLRLSSCSTSFTQRSYAVVLYNQNITHLLPQLKTPVRRSISSCKVVSREWSAFPMRSFTPLSLLPKKVSFLVRQRPSLIMYLENCKFPSHFLPSSSTCTGRPTFITWWIFFLL